MWLRLGMAMPPKNPHLKCTMLQQPMGMPKISNDFSLWAYPSPNTIPSCLPLPSSSPMIDPMMIHPSFHMAPPSGQAINLVKDLIQRCCIPEEAKGSWSEGPMRRILPQKAIVAVWTYLSLPALQSWSGWHHTLPPTLSPIVQLSCSPDASVSPIFAMWTPLL